jgi:hypothetical protein
MRNRRIVISLVFVAALSFAGPLFSQDADTVWTRTYGGSGNESGISVKQTADGGYIVAGRTDSYGAGSSDIYLVRTDASGDTLSRPSPTAGTLSQDTQAPSVQVPMTAIW